MPECTDLQKAWAESYVGEARFNATKAAEIVGLTPTQGPKMRSKEHVMAYVEELQRGAVKSRLISQARVLEEIIGLALSDMTEIVQVEDGKLIIRNFADLPRHVRTSIKKIKLRRQNKGEGDFDEVLELELHDKLKPLEMLAKWQGLLDGDGKKEDEETPVFTGLTIVGPDTKKGK